MSEQRKTSVVTSEDVVTTEKFQWSDLLKKEDWLAVWIGSMIYHYCSWRSK